MAVKTYVEAPKTVEAIRLLTREDFDAALAWIRGEGKECTSVILEGSLLGQSYIMIHRDHGGRTHADWGQWITLDSNGLFHVVEPDLFDHLYVSAEAIG
jgi:hypothetical protein